MTRDDRQDLEDAEQRLFVSMGIAHRVYTLNLVDAPVDRARVIETGEGTPVLLVHGSGMTAAIWAPLAAALPAYRLIAVDLPGCGLTDPFDYRGVDLHEHATTFLVAVIDALGLVRAPIVSNSFGALLALRLAAAEPGRVLDLVLLGAPAVALPGARASLPMALYSRPRLGRLLAAASPPIRPFLARRLLATICGRAAVDGQPGELFEVVAAAMRISDPTTRTLMPELFRWRRPFARTVFTDVELAEVVASTLMIWGADDRFQAPDAGARACRLMPEARLVVIPGGHHPWWDDAHRCAELIHDHLGGIRPSGPSAADG